MKNENKKTVKKPSASDKASKRSSGNKASADTLVYKDKNGEIQEENFMSKINFYPTIKSCVVALGFNRLSADFYHFQKRLIVKDIEKVVEFIEAHFLDSLDLSKYGEVQSVGPDMIGNLEIFGYSNLEKRLLYYTIVIDRLKITAHKRDFDSQTLIMHPDIIEETKQKTIERNSKSQLKETIVELMKDQYNESLSKDTYKVALGGEIILTQLFTQPEFGCHFSTGYTFENYNELFARAVEKTHSLNDAEENR